MLTEQEGRKELKLEFFFEAILYNRGFTNLITIGISSLFFSPPVSGGDELDLYRIIYTVLIGVGFSGLLCWVFAFKLFNKRFKSYYYLWLFCYLIETSFYIFSLSQLINENLSLVSIPGMLIGIVVPLIITEALLSLRYNRGTKVYAK